MLSRTSPGHPVERVVAVTVDFEAYVAARGPALLRLALLLTGDEADAQDVVQEALSRALPRWDRIVKADNPDAYVRRMVINENTSKWRRFRRRETPVSQVQATSSLPSAAEVSLEHIDNQQLWAACDSLPRSQRVAVVLRYYEQLSYAEIGALTNVAEASARSRVHRGLAALRAQMTTPLQAETGERDE